MTYQRTLLLFGLLCVPALLMAQKDAADPAEVTIGERLFLETRFSQFFKTFLDHGGGVNDPLPAGDPVVAQTITTHGPLPGPFAGTAMNCRSCHLVDEHVGATGGGMRTYADFARRSPVPARVGDPTRNSPRNSPALVNASLPRDVGTLLHFDGEFVALDDLIGATFSGRNFGWQPGEKQQAIALMARVIRQDDGQGSLAGDFGGLSYSTVLTGTSPEIPKELRLPKQFRIDVASASDRELFDAVTKLVAAYTEQLVFSQDKRGAFNLSPFDVFLERNKLSREPGPHESALEYSRRLMQLVNALDAAGRLRFVTANPNTGDGNFQFHDQPFRFTREELEGMRVFFGEPSGGLSPQELAVGGVGNCIACHAAPNFTDFRLHNTGVTQIEYDALHGAGTFAVLQIPTLEERTRDPDAYLPATEFHPTAKGIFRAIPSAQNRLLTDLGAWNIFLNSDFPKPQYTLYQLLCEDALGERITLASLFDRCAPTALLTKSVATFKTPGLRDLSHSAPYMHNGQFDTLEDVARFYQDAADLRRAGALRNAPAQFAQISLKAADITPLAQFLRSMNEDYE